ncbi:hypothetical protein PG993_007547 [Apiospora rasikravindrae]|uniref:Uncharacterized protein n=1 Tax=Apiospora rasikravindrae TaxID=990691 RepID=A0ABR1SXT3_9PEZI
MPTRSGKAYKPGSPAVTVTVEASASSANQSEENVASISAPTLTTAATTASTPVSPTLAVAPDTPVALNTPVAPSTAPITASSTPAAALFAPGWDEPIPTPSPFPPTPSPGSRGEKRTRDVFNDRDDELQDEGPELAARPGKRVRVEVKEDSSPQQASPATSMPTDIDAVHSIAAAKKLYGLKPQSRLKGTRVSSYPYRNDRYGTLSKDLPWGRTKHERILKQFFPEKLAAYYARRRWVKPVGLLMPPPDPAAVAATPDGLSASALLTSNFDEVMQNREQNMRQQEEREQKEQEELQSRCRELARQRRLGRQSPGRSPNRGSSSPISRASRGNTNSTGLSHSRHVIHVLRRTRAMDRALHEMGQLQRRPGFLRRIVQTGQRAVESRFATAWNSVGTFVRDQIMQIAYERRLREQLEQHEQRAQQELMQQQMEQQQQEQERLQQEALEQQNQPHLPTVGSSRPPPRRRRQARVTRRQEPQGTGGKYYCPDFSSDESGSDEGSSPSRRSGRRSPRRSPSPPLFEPEREQQIRRDLDNLRDRDISPSASPPTASS